MSAIIYAMKLPTLLFVYNADSGLANALLDAGRRIFNPSQYPCALCMVTYGPFGMKNDWKEFTDRLAYTVEFMHKDELPKRFQAMRINFPCLLIDGPKGIDVLISATEFESIRDLATLKKVVTQKLELRPR